MLMDYQRPITVQILIAFMKQNAMTKEWVCIRISFVIPAEENIAKMESAYQNLRVAMACTIGMRMVLIAVGAVLLVFLSGTTIEVQAKVR